MVRRPQRERTVSLAAPDILIVLCSLATVLVAAHVGGWLADQLRLPAMVGELAGGLVLGPTVLLQLLPGMAMFVGRGEPGGPGEAAAVILEAGGQCGLLLLMFTAGLQMRTLVTRDDARTVGWVASLGVLVPVAAGVVVLWLVDLDTYVGSAGSQRAFAIVLCAALAVTSIPVITRIFLDLGLLETRLARIVLCVAVLEDVLLYVAVSLALGIVGASAAGDASLPALLGVRTGSVAFVTWHVAASALMLAMAAWAPGFLGRRGGELRNPVAARSPVAWAATWLCVVTGFGMLLGLAPMLGALVAGIAASRDPRPTARAAHRQLQAAGTACFVPIYFAGIGLQLDLVRAFDWRLVLGLLLVGTVVKYGSTRVGAAIAGEDPRMARAIAVSVNARGGPGIVLATTSFAAGIVEERAFTALILLAVVTSIGAGAWLARSASVARIARAGGHRRLARPALA